MVLLLIAGAAGAGTYGQVTLNYSGISSAVGTITFHSDNGQPYDGRQAGGAGEMSFTVTAATPNGDLGGNPFYGLGPNGSGQTINAFCIDLMHYVSNGATYDVQALASAAVSSGEALKLSELAFLHLTDSRTSSVKSSAFQAAVWEIVYETSASYDLDSGSFSVTGLGSGAGSVHNLAESWLAGLGSASSTLGDYALINTSGTSQNYAYLITGTGNTSVPEPVTMISGFLAVAGLGAYVRRKMRVPAAA